MSRTRTRPTQKRTIAGDCEENPPAYIAYQEWISLVYITREMVIALVQMLGAAAFVHMRKKGYTAFCVHPLSPHTYNDTSRVILAQKLYFATKKGKIPLECIKPLAFKRESYWAYTLSRYIRS